MRKINTKERKLVFIDLEMTGLDPDRHEIADIGMIVVNPKTFEIEVEYETKTKIANLDKADEVALEIFGYKTKEWKDAIPLKDALEEVAKHTKDAIFVGWNMALDWQFLEDAFKKYKVEHGLDYHRLDVFAMAYLKYFNDPKVKDISLRKIAKHLGVEIPQKHGAMVDIKATYEVFKILMKK